MLDIIQKNKTYFQLYLVFFFALFIYVLKAEPLEATLYFGAHRSSIGDAFFKFVTTLGEVYPFIAFTIFYLWNHRPLTARKMALSGIFILLITSLLKEVFSHDRPAIFIDKMLQLSSFQYVEGIEILRGATSFPSGHTAGAFAVWSLFAFQLQSPILKTLCLVIAILVGISRVYLTQHFPEDVLFGSTIGIAAALFIEYIIEHLEVRKQR